MHIDLADWNLDPSLKHSHGGRYMIIDCNNEHCCNMRSLFCLENNSFRIINGHTMDRQYFQINPNIVYTG